MLRVDAISKFVFRPKKYFWDLGAYWTYVHRTVYKPNYRKNWKEEARILKEYDTREFCWSRFKSDLENFFKVPVLESKVRYALIGLGLMLFLKGTLKYSLFAAPIAVDAANDVATGTGNHSSVSGSHTTTGSNLVLVAGVTDPVGPIPDRLSAFTYASADLTLGAQRGVSQYGTGLYYKITPASGANTLSYTAIGVDGTGTNPLSLFAASFTGAHQTSQPDGTGTANSAGATSSSVSVTTSFNNTFLVDIMVNANGATASTIGTGQTSIVEAQLGTGASRRHGSYKQLVTSGTTTMSWSWSPSKAFDACSMGVREAPATAKVSSLTLLGVG